MELIDKTVPAAGSPFSAVVSMFYEPSATFARLAQRRATWLPLLLVMGAMFGVTFWYFGYFVDFDWFQQELLATIDDPEMRDRQASAGMPQQVMAYMSALGAAFGLLFAFAITGLYFLIVGKVRNSDFGFRKGFALAAWSSLPTFLIFPLGALTMLLAADNRVPFEAINPLSLNQLIFHFERAHPMATWLENMSILFFWGVVLQVIGYQVWAEVKRSTAIKIVVTPYAVIYGVWLAYALSKTV